MGPSASSGRRTNGPSGEYCRVCRTTGHDDAERARMMFGEGKSSEDFRPTADLRVSVPSANVLNKTGGDMDVIAIPYVFRFLCAELASMGIAVSLEVR
jgi:DNA-directed RNA polymerase I subunit RPA2